MEQAVQNAPPGIDIQRTFSNLLEETARLKSITQKLLLLSQADSGRLPLHKEPLDFSLLVKEITEDVPAMNPNLKFESEIEPDIWTDGDKRLLEQALLNLTDNAVKYNIQNGFIRVSLKKRKDRILLTIANAGKNIPEDLQDKNFDRFFRGNPAHNRKKEGFGLGLALSREIARAHGGDIVLEESGGGITRFTLKLNARKRDSS